MTTEIEFKTYYAVAPGAAFRIENAPTFDAARGLADRVFTRDAVDVWGWAAEAPTEVPVLTTLDWCELSPEVWLAFDGWPELMAILTDEECGFSDYDLAVSLSERRGAVMAAVLRIASNYLSGALGEAEKAAAAGVSGARAAYDAIIEDVEGWLWREAREWERVRPGDALPGGQVVAVLTEEDRA